MPLSTTSLSGSSLPLEKYYPVLTLPTEITSGIFTHFLPLYPSFPPLTGLESPNLLTHICHDWREIALNTPRLWRAIPIFGRHAERGHLELIRLWLQRSQPMPLSLRIWSPYWPLADSAITAIIPHRHRYAYLYLRFPHASAVAAIDGPMPLLQHLDLHCRVQIEWFFRAALTLPWAQLTSLKAIQWMRPTDPEPILMSCPNLLHLDLSEVGNYWHPRDNITLARLESLKIYVAILGAAPLGSPPSHPTRAPPFSGRSRRNRPRDRWLDGFCGERSLFPTGSALHHRACISAEFGGHVSHSVSLGIRYLQLGLTLDYPKALPRPPTGPTIIEDDVQSFAMPSVLAKPPRYHHAPLRDGVPIPVPDSTLRPQHGLV
ncbi:hypothetical protein B0H16DRAFT_1857475 [Mycena metata]|uniref:F-box domain-containing protein n=1 Tax=Mycena metata TaxID=1033252 RepID=A0AAD7N427_9AGAR|nr:hypothetical protein B0H16DRAFT_1857475 [Mycena metata]